MWNWDSRLTLPSISGTTDPAISAAVKMTSKSCTALRLHLALSKSMTIAVGNLPRDATFTLKCRATT
jgi:hypothetical protein